MELLNTRERIVIALSVLFFHISSTPLGMLVAPFLNLSWVVIVLSLSATVYGDIRLHFNSRDDDTEDVKAQNT